MSNTLKLSVLSITIWLFSYATVSSQNHALSFDGVNDYVDISSVIDDMSTNTGTVMAWAYPTACGHNKYVFEANKSGINRFYLHWSQCSFRASRGNPVGTVVLSENTPLNKWYHLTLVWDNGIVKGYLNGIYKGQIGYTNNGSISRAYIGMQPGGGKYFSGNIDEVSVWNRVLSQEEIKQNVCKKLTGNETGLVAYYPMNEGKDNSCYGGEDVCDKSGNGNDGVKH